MEKSICIAFALLFLLLQYLPVQSYPIGSQLQRDTEVRNETDNNDTTVDEVLKALTIGLRQADELKMINDTFGQKQVDEQRCIPVRYNLKCDDEPNLDCTVQPKCSIRTITPKNNMTEKERTLFLWLKFEKSRLYFDKFLLLVDFYRFPLFALDSDDICDITSPTELLLKDVKLPCGTNESLIQEALKLLTTLLPYNAARESAQNFTDDTSKANSKSQAIYFQFVIDLKKYLIGLVAILTFFSILIVASIGKEARKGVSKYIKPSDSSRGFNNSYHHFWSAMLLIVVWVVVQHFVDTQEKEFKETTDKYYGWFIGLSFGIGLVYATFTSIKWIHACEIRPPGDAEQRQPGNELLPLSDAEQIQLGNVQRGPGDAEQIQPGNVQRGAERERGAESERGAERERGAEHEDRDDSEDEDEHDFIPAKFCCCTCIEDEEAKWERPILKCKCGTCCPKACRCSTFMNILATATIVMIFMYALFSIPAIALSFYLNPIKSLVKLSFLQFAILSILLATSVLHYSYEKLLQSCSECWLKTNNCKYCKECECCMKKTEKQKCECKQQDKEPCTDDQCKNRHCRNYRCCEGRKLCAGEKHKGKQKCCDSESCTRDKKCPRNDCCKDNKCCEGRCCPCCDNGCCKSRDPIDGCCDCCHTRYYKTFPTRKPGLQQNTDTNSHSSIQSADAIINEIHNPHKDCCKDDKHHDKQQGCCVRTKQVKCRDCCEVFIKGFWAVVDIFTSLGVLTGLIWMMVFIKRIIDDSFSDISVANNLLTIVLPAVITSGAIYLTKHKNKKETFIIPSGIHLDHGH